MNNTNKQCVAIYCRLSKDDIISNAESSSISTQRIMLEKYARERHWLIHDYYIDDGWSGTNFNRPEFQRLLVDIENERINTVLVKDLSRLGRNYILTGHYTEIFFPAKNVRFIALDDGIDTLNNSNDIAPFKNILNEMYAKDISKKIRSAVKTRKEKGEFLSNYAPYGYKKNPDNKNKLIIDELSAPIVKSIFEMALSGIGSVKIAKNLNRDKILPPIEYRKMSQGKQPNYQKLWGAAAVLHILKNRIYVGDMVQGLYECSQFKRTPSKRKPKDDWLITPDTHEPIVNADIWDKVQLIIAEHHKVNHAQKPHLFSGFLKCNECGYAISFSSSHMVEYYSCAQYRRYGNQGCSSHYIRKDELKQYVISEIKKYANMAKRKRSELESLLESQHRDELDSLDLNLSTLTSRSTEIKNLMKQLYEDNVNQKISDKVFSTLLIEYEAEQIEVEANLKEVNDRIKSIKNYTSDSVKWINAIKKYSNISDLNREILTELIDKILISEEKTADKRKIDIKIHFLYVGEMP